MSLPMPTLADLVPLFFVHLFGRLPAGIIGNPVADATIAPRADCVLAVAVIGDAEDRLAMFGKRRDQVARGDVAGRQRLMLADDDLFRVGA